MRSLLHENEFCVQFHFHANQSHKNGFAHRLALKQRDKGARKRPIGLALCTPHYCLKKLAPIFHPIRSKTKTNHDSHARVFPHFVLATSVASSFDWFIEFSVSFVIG